METKVLPRTVAEAMTMRPIAVRPETPIGELFALFEQHDINGIPVTDRRGVLVGVVTKLDLLRMFHSPGDEDERKRRRGERAIDLMTRGLVTVDSTDSVATAIDLMIDFRLRMLPVVERRNFERHLIGVVSRTDLLRWVEVT